MANLGAQRITNCGAGALGSQLPNNLARQGFKDLRVNDRDRIEEHNVGTQLYGESNIGAWKVEVLCQRLFRTSGIEIGAFRTPCGASSLMWPKVYSKTVHECSNVALKRLCL